MSSNGKTSPVSMDALQETVQELIRQANRPKSADAIAREQAMAALDRLGHAQIGDEAVVFKGEQFILPEALGGSLEDAIAFLEALREAEETEFEFSRTYVFRPMDGAAAFERAMKRTFGTTGVGKATYSFFGKNPPQYRTVNTGVNETLQVPWGRIEFSPLKAKFDLGATYSDEDGIVFAISVSAPRKHRRRIEGFLSVVEDELRKNSIYRGKAINAAEEPGFLDLSVDPGKVIYTQETMRQLNANLWSVLTYADNLRKSGQTLKRAVLLEGPYGSGKTLAGNLSGQHAVANGWTFIQVRPGDDPYAALRTARVYAPALVWVEDLDVLIAGKDRKEVSKVLDALDNAANKGAEIMVGFTTNFPETLEKGVLRPGRIDAVIHIGGLDAEAHQRLIRATIPAEMLDTDMNWDEVGAAFKEFLPSFGVEAASRALRYAMVRGKGTVTPITTADLVEAAADLQSQLDLLNNASETKHGQPTMDGLFENVLTEVLNRTQVDHGQVEVLDKD